MNEEAERVATRKLHFRLYYVLLPMWTLEMGHIFTVLAGLSRGIPIRHIAYIAWFVAYTRIRRMAYGRTQRWAFRLHMVLLGVYAASLLCEFVAGWRITAGVTNSLLFMAFAGMHATIEPDNPELPSQG